MNQPAMTVERATIQQPTTIEQPLHGAWLLTARAAWVVVALGILVLNFIMLPQFLKPSLHSGWHAASRLTWRLEK